MSFSRIADMARDITDACGSGSDKNNRVSGEMRDPMGFSVVISSFNC